MLLPSFSIVLETENLANADIQGLARSLDSLAVQEPKPTAANEVWLIAIPGLKSITSLLARLTIKPKCWEPA
jgi:hypothetical protein